MFTLWLTFGVLKGDAQALEVMLDLSFLLRETQNTLEGMVFIRSSHLVQKY